MTLEFFLPQKKTLVKNIYLSVTGTEKTTIKTPLRISDEEWDSAKQRPKNIYLKKNKRLNTQLDRIKSQLPEYIRKDKKKISQRMLSRKIQKICSSETNPLPNTLLYYTQQYINSRKGMICSSTYKRYLVFLRLLERFEGRMCQIVYLDGVNADFVRDFILFGKEENYSESTVYRTLNFVKTILNFLEKRGIRTYVYELELPKEKRDKKIVTLNEENLLKIKKKEVPNQLQAAKDWLLISCYTGQRISDFMNFDTAMIKKIENKNCLSFTQQKTGKNILLPLHPEVYSIIERNGFRFPPKIPVQTYNAQVKEVAKIAGIDHLVTFNKRQGHRAVTHLIPKWKAISSHIGRRSFASNFYGKIPTALLMEATGHSTEQMFQRYINITDPSRVLELGRYFEKLSLNN
ncbi:phage integrase SAM-like domain-containing protein [Avrilella dinanensis]|uniref:phage integrase SAM-like domain-containing protein n=1 Tax=Avrilella dinanensis TaxID=2008672 RepID=UPI002408F947|nr:phage integrase SAM-like domain-containing protein [Avrilella dinanensis]